MITYVDTSTLIKLIIDEPGSDQAEGLWDQASDLVSARIGYVEARAALAAAKHSQRLDSAQHRDAITQLDMLWSQLSIVEITAEVIDRAVKLADDHSLRGYDAVHLAAALIANSEVFTSADRKLCEAARASGLHVANPTETLPQATAKVLPDLNEPTSPSLVATSFGLFGVPIPAGAEPLQDPSDGFRLRGGGTIQDLTAFYKDAMSTAGWIFDADFSTLDPYQSEERPHVGYITQSVFAKPTTPVTTVAIIVGNFDGKPGQKQDLRIYIVHTPDDELPARALSLRMAPPPGPVAD